MSAGSRLPLVLTLQLDEAAQERFDALRRAHFPPERNHLQAHVTLFHALPAAYEDEVRADLRASAQRPAYDVDVVRVRSLGRGVAYDLRSPELAAQRGELARRWQPWLTPQDARPHAAHVQCRSVRRRAARCRIGRVPAACARGNAAQLGGARRVAVLVGFRQRVQEVQVAVVGLPGRA